MATSKTTKKTAAKKAPKPAAPKKAPAHTTELPEAVALEGRTIVANPALAEYSFDTQAAAAALVANQPQLTNYSDQLGGAVETQIDRVKQAVQLRENAARRVQDAQANRDAVDQQELKAMATVEATPDAVLLRAPITNAMQKPAGTAAPPGYHPDITSPLGGDFGKRPPGTGVAALEDLAPGQDITPCAATGLSIRPLPDKPGEPFSQL